MFRAGVTGGGKAVVGTVTASSVLQSQTVRSDSTVAVEETLGLSGVPGRRLFLSRYRPMRTSLDRPVVICPPILQDFLQNYRREVLLARRLAAAGIPVARFHYRGSGHSEGNAVTTSFSDLRDDALVAANAIAGEGSPLIFVGARFGALVAGAAAGVRHGSRLALWEPSISGRAFFNEAFLALRARDVKEQRKAAPAQRQLDDNGLVDVLGCALYRSLYDSAQSLTLQDLTLGKRAAPVLSQVFLAQFAPQEDLRPAYRKLVEAYHEEGVSTTVERIHSSQPWWFLENQPVAANDLVDRTVAWCLSAQDKS